MRFFEIYDRIAGGDETVYVGRIALESDGTGYVVLADRPGEVFEVREKTLGAKWKKPSEDGGIVQPWLLNRPEGKQA